MFTLPRWARRTHPITAHTFDRLPGLLVQRRSRAGRALLLGITALVPCSLFVGGVPLQLVLIPLGWLPLVWAVPLVNEERTRQTWDLLRLTPYSTREIVLARMSAVAHRLRPLLGALFSGQVAALVSGVIFLQFTLLSGGIRAINGAWIRQPVTSPAMYGAMAGIILVSLAALPVEFALSLTLGTLASLWRLRRGAALAAALGGRLLLLGVLLVAGLGITPLLSGQPASPLMVFGASVIAGPVGWPLLGIPTHPGAMLGLSALLLALDVALLGAALGAVLWRVERMGA